MKSSLIKGIAVLAAAGGMALATAPAANASLQGVCVFTGAANVHSDPVIWVGGGGNFGFTSQIAACAGSHDNAPDVRPAMSIDVNEGTYTSVVCGTSTLDGAQGVAELRDDSQGGELEGTSAFAIPFVAGQGVILGTFDGAGDFEGEAGTVAGAVTIFPNNAVTAATITGGQPNSTPGAPPNGVCVDNYGVAGAFALIG